MPTQVRRRAPGSPGVSLKQIRSLADAMLDKLELAQAELSVLLTNDEQMRGLNRAHRHKDRPTDVLSFVVQSKIVVGKSGAPRIMGDVVISLDTAARQASSRKRPLIVEIRWLLAHGILHLVGFDHATAHQKKRMASWTARLVRAAKLPEIALAAAVQANPSPTVKTPGHTRKDLPTRRN